MLDEPAMSVEDSKAGDVLRKITSNDGPLSEIVVEHVLTLSNGESSAEEFDDMRPQILQCNRPESVKRLIYQVKECYTFQQYDANYGLCRTLLESSVYDICKRCELISKRSKHCIPIEKCKWDKLHKKVSSGLLSPSLSSYKIILYISIAYKQENTLRVLQLRCCVDFMNESDDCSSGAARSGVNFQMPVNRFLQSFRL